MDEESESESVAVSVLEESCLEPEKKLPSLVAELELADSKDGVPVDLEVCSMERGVDEVGACQ